MCLVAQLENSFSVFDVNIGREIFNELAFFDGEILSQGLLISLFANSREFSIARSSSIELRQPHWSL